MSFNTASGKHCCNNKGGDVTFDVREGFNTASGRHCCNYATKSSAGQLSTRLSFNTASGRHCCNLILKYQNAMN